MEVTSRLFDLLGRDGTLCNPVPAQGVKILDASTANTAAPSGAYDGYPTRGRTVTVVAYCADAGGGAGTYDLVMYVLMNGIWMTHDDFSVVGVTDFRVTTAANPVTDPLGKEVYIPGDRWYLRQTNTGVPAGTEATVVAVEGFVI